MPKKESLAKCLFSDFYYNIYPTRHIIHLDPFVRNKSIFLCRLFNEGFFTYPFTHESEYCAFIYLLKKDLNDFI